MTPEIVSIIITIIIETQARELMDRRARFMPNFHIRQVLQCMKLRCQLRIASLRKQYCAKSISICRERYNRLVSFPRINLTTVIENKAALNVLKSCTPFAHELSTI
jgi:hypothetical protein